MRRNFTCESFSFFSYVVDTCCLGINTLDAFTNYFNYKVEILVIF